MGAAAQRLPAILRQRLRWISLTPFDQSTAQGRADERHRRVALTALAAALAKILSVGTALISVPLTLHYLGSERFGMWMTISSLIAMLSFADFGIANGVLSAVAAAHGKDDRIGIQRVVSGGFYMLVAIAVAILSLFAAIYVLVPWPVVFNIRGDLARIEAGPAVASFVFCFAVAIPLTMVQRVQMGLQQGFITSLWQCFGSVLALLGILLAIHLQGGLPWLVLALAGSPLIASTLNNLHFYGRLQPLLRPRRSMFTRDVARSLVSTGVLFFVLQITVAVAYTSDNLVIAQLLGAAAVAEYAVPEKMFGLITLGLSMALSPLWPAYGEAIARGDGAWVRGTLRRSFMLAVGVAAIISSSLFLAGPTIIRYWVGEAVIPSALLLAALACWKVTEAGGNAVAMYLNGARIVKLQVWCAIPTAAAAISLKLWLVPRMGVSGAAWASVLGYLIFTAAPIGFQLPRFLAAKPATA